jgi:hypothetical protein
VLLAGVGVAVFLRDRRWVSLFALLIFTAALIYMGRVYARDPHSVKLNAYGVPHEILYSSTQSGLPIANFTGAMRVGANEFVSSETTTTIELDFTTLKNINRYTLQQIAIEGSILSHAQPASCEPVTYSYRKQSQNDFSLNNAWQDIWPTNGKLHLNILGHQAPLEIIEPGTLRMRFVCGMNTRITFSKVEVLRPTVALYYREQYLKSIGATDWSHLNTKKPALSTKP